MRTQFISGLKGTSAAVVFIAIFGTIMTLTDVWFYNSSMILVILIPLSVAIPVGFYPLEKLLCKKGRLGYNIGFFIISVYVMWFLLIPLANSDAFDEFYKRVHPQDDSFLAGIQYGIFWIFLAGALIIALIVRVVIFIVQRFRANKRAVDEKFTEK